MGGGEPIYMDGPRQARILDAEDRSWVERARSVAYAPEPLDQVLHRISTGEYHVLRLSPGILVARVLESGLERELNVYMLAGRNVLRELPEVSGSLRALAQFFGCKWISGIAIRPGLERKYRRLGARSVGTYMLMEV
jgi:hypothetical protein